MLCVSLGLLLVLLLLLILNWSCLLLGLLWVALPLPDCIVQCSRLPVKFLFLFLLREYKFLSFSDSLLFCWSLRSAIPLCRRFLTFLRWYTLEATVWCGIPRDIFCPIGRCSGFCGCPHPSLFGRGGACLPSEWLPPLPAVTLP